MKVYTIFTGGTIGSRKGRGGFLTPENRNPYRLLQLYHSRYQNDTEFVVKEPYRILSENLDAASLQKLIWCVWEGLREPDVKGIVVTHGTDTLSYSAAILSYLFGGAAIPIVLVSSDYILDDTRANGLDNLRYALEFIRKKQGTGVFVSYRNQGGLPFIHRGTRLLQHHPFSADVMSAKDTWYGKFEEDRYTPNTGYNVREGIPALPVEPEHARLIPCAGEILRIVPYVGMPYPEIGDKVKAVLHESFHSGTIAVSGDLKRFAAEADERNIPIYLTGLSETETEYETVKHYRDLRIRPLHESAPISQYCKLWLAVSNGLDLRRLMEMSVAEDFL